ncbi:MAG: hypothetical protein D6689_21910 [Deltaproteobacteria bacterium]|nr:MAG: hypothetical protein D6689_21910 [Deltaproteobacteria bacterium]
MRGPAALRIAGVAVVAAAAVATARAHAAGAADGASNRFDHRDHAAKLKATDDTVLACERCHASSPDGTLVPVGKRDHQPCKQCHGKIVMSRRELERSRKKDWCAFCHAKTKTGPRQFVALYSHRVHVRPGGSGKQCEACHGAFGDAPPRTGDALRAGHALCGGCHATAAEPKMTSCAGCHVDATSERGRAAATARPSNPFSVAGAFDHEKHANARRVGREGRACLTCHANIAQAETDDVVPLPTMKGCFDTCHDGAKAFSAVGATCTRCHASPAQPPVATPTAPLPRYDHARHATRRVDQSDCTACHALDAAFAVRPATAAQPHRPCSDAGCHAGEFFSRRPQVCGTCHDGTAPWIAQPAVARRRADSDFGRDISHAAHARAGAGDCKACHGDPYRGDAAGSGHAACAPCHGQRAQPAMTACAGCHRPREAAAVARAPSAWSVAATFRHETHAVDPRGGGEPACTVCHEAVARAERVADIAPPTMRSCDACHDGERAFKTTGFGCYRCHRREER